MNDLTSYLNLYVHIPESYVFRLILYFSSDQLVKFPVKLLIVTKLNNFNLAVSESNKIYLIFIATRGVCFI